MRRSFLLLASLFLSVSLCLAQTSSQGTIYGTVTDSSGAVVPGAQVTAANLATGVTREAPTSATGDYRMDFLPPGNYQLTVKQSGFETATLTGITLLVGQALTVNAQLKVGATTQQMNVTANVTSLNTSSASRGNVMENVDIQNLPLNGREFLSLATLTPGAVDNAKPAEGIDSKDGNVFSFNGGRSSYNSFYLDDSQNTSAGDNTMVSSPSIDAIREFLIQTNMFSARYGQGNDVISVVTKSGTNAFHGTLYEYHRNKVLDALPMFYTGTRESAPNALWNQFGGTVGGPIRKNKTFFFFNAEFFRQLAGGSEIVGFAPTAAERVGDVSQAINAWGSDPVRLTNPYTGADIPSLILPQNLITPVGTALMSLWPDPNYQANPLVNYRVFRGSTNKNTKYLVRIDQNFSSRDVLSGTFNFGNYANGSPGQIPIDDTVGVMDDHNLSLTYSHIFTPTLVNNLGLSGNQYFYGSHFLHDDKNYGVAWGLDPTTNVDVGPPWIVLFQGSITSMYIGGYGATRNFDHTEYLHDDLTWQKGSHTLQFGGMWWKQSFNWSTISAMAMYYMNLDDGINAADATFRVTGTPYTDLLTAVPNLYIFGQGNGADNHFGRSTQALYYQDDWKVTRKLTFNYGIRWENEEPFRSQDKHMVSIDWNTGEIQYETGAPGLGVIQYPYETGGPATTYKSVPRAFAPRVGFAYRPFKSDRTVVRGGYGIFFLGEPAVNMEGSTSTVPFGGIIDWTPKVNPEDGQNHLEPLNEPPYGYSWVEGHSAQGFTTNTPRYPRSYMQQFNLTVGHDFGHNLSTEVAYVGSNGVNLVGWAAYSTYDPALQQKFDEIYGPSFAPALRSKGYNSQYSSLQIDVKKRMARGLDFHADYTWSHNLADASCDVCGENYELGYQTAGAAYIYKRYRTDAGTDLHNRFSVYGVYELPFGRGRQLGSNWPGALDKVAGGWTMNYIFRAQSGFPFSVMDPTNQMPDRVCNGNLPKSVRSWSNWFDTACFPTHYQANGTSGGGDASPNAIYGPGVNNMDMGIHKSIKFTESKNLEFRAEAFNAWNHPQPEFSYNGLNWFTNNPAAAELTTCRNQREVQLALRLTF